MLDNLVNTKLKRKLLNIFFRFPKRSFYPVELKAMTLAGSGGIAAALRELAREGVIHVAAKRKKRYFSINSYFPFYDELRDAVAPEFKTQADDEVTKKLKRLQDLKLIVLTGIFTMQPHLPVDLLLVGSSSLDRGRLLKVLDGVGDLAGQEINYAVMDVDEFDYRRYLNDRLIRDVLDNPHLVIYNNL